MQLAPGPVGSFVLMAAMLGIAVDRSWAADTLQIREVQIAIVATQGREPLPYISGCLPAGPGVDVLWSPNAIYLMRKAGEVRKIWSTDAPNHQIERATYDGKYVWIPIRPESKLPALLVLDPKRGSYFTVEKKDGLPVVEQEPYDLEILQATGVGEGKAVAAGSRGRLALVQVTPGGKKDVKVFHEPKESPEGSKESWKNPAVTYRPAFCFALAGADKGSVVLVGRYSQVHDVTLHPLVVDVATRGVTVLEETLSGQTDLCRYALHQGQLFHVPAVPQGKELSLMRLAAPGLKRELLFPAAEGWLVVGDQAVHILGTHWWAGSLGGGKVEKAVEQLPWRWSNTYAASPRSDERPLGPREFQLIGAWPSQHYGILVAGTSDEFGFKIWTVGQPGKAR